MSTPTTDLVARFRARVSADKRAEIRVKIYLDPDSAARLSQLTHELGELQRSADEGSAVKLNGRLSQVQTEIEDAERELLDSLAYVVLRALTAEQAAEAAAGLTADDPMSRLWKANLRHAFVRVEDADRTPVELTRDDWTGLLDVLSATELHSMHLRLAEADAATTPS